MQSLDFKSQASRHLSMQRMAANGYGWEDICVQWEIKDVVEQLRIRRMVLGRPLPACGERVRECE